eukprot:TRINITY_DN13076_c0_g1_i8.p1 TRINITY_DN13076_c0_g1~~TRINITY_DN13076_c0_g1_i8.p1  ORF type:complete len:243 (+),score=73.43 TRINITY_DN13076_c0_g1_i8:73-801(+)
MCIRDSIYAGHNQFDQRSILLNTCGSEKYETLLSRLGQFLGKNNAYVISNSQPSILYHATATYEVVFHVATLIETHFDDTQQIKKKKYIGNDSVHIVWNENDRKYKSGTITSAFNFVHIVITPLRNGLCKVMVEKKRGVNEESGKPMVKYFGPVISGMQMQLDAVPCLVRHTAVNARKSVTYKKMQAFNPVTERRKMLAKLVKSFAVQCSDTTNENVILNRLLHSSAAVSYTHLTLPTICSV